MEQHKKSTHVVEIVPVTLQPHPAADTLSIVQIHGYQCVVKTADWQGVQKAAYLVPDSVVDTDRPEFSFLKEKPIILDGVLVGKTVDPSIKLVRIKAKKLRGITSFGLMIPVPNDTPLGEDWAERLGITHYEPELEAEKKSKNKLNVGDTEPGPDLNTGPHYDIDAGRRYARTLFEQGEPVVVTEKLDGSNCRVVWHDGRLWVKSRSNWKRRTPDLSKLTVESLVEKGVPPEKAEDIVRKAQAGANKVSTFWAVVEATPGLVELCRENPGTVVFGEVYGNTNAIKYGFPDGNRFAAFDIYRDGRFLDFEDAYALAKKYGVPWAPLLHPWHDTPSACDACVLSFDFDRICEMAEGPTLAVDAKPKVIREGVVVRTLRERYCPRLGRAVLKWVSGSFLERYR